MAKEKGFLVGQHWSRETIAECLRLEPDDPRLTDEVCEFFVSDLWQVLAEKALGDAWDETTGEARDYTRDQFPEIDDTKIEEKEA